MKSKLTLLGLIVVTLSVFIFNSYMQKVLGFQVNLVLNSLWFFVNTFLIGGYYLLSNRKFIYQISPGQIKKSIYLGFIISMASNLISIYIATAYTVFGGAYNISSHPVFKQEISTVIILPLLVPVCEELFFRGLLMDFCSLYLSDKANIILSGLLFGAAHLTLMPMMSMVSLLPLLMGVTCGGFLFAFLRLKSGRLMPAIIAHISFNTAGVLLEVVHRSLLGKL